jgi:superoxide dismutase, Fe-Mn family
MKKILFLLSGAIMLIANHAHAQQPNNATANNNSNKPYTAKNYDYLLGKIKGLDDELLKMHFKLYQGYVTNANKLLDKIRDLDAKKDNRGPEFAGYKHMLGWEFDGMILHEYYFENLGGDKPLDEKSPIMQKIKADYGSYENWKSDFIATGLMRGIGWSIAYIEPLQGRLINVWINEHDLGHLADGNPLLIMDVFEHAYITQFGLDRAKYIDVFFNNINWNEVEQRYKNSQ